MMMHTWGKLLGWLGRDDRRTGAGPGRGTRAGGRNLVFEALEERSLLSISNPFGFAGLAFPDSVFSVPPDTHAAVGTAQIVEAVNSAIAFYDKSNGTNLLLKPLDEFFSIDLSTCRRSSIFDPKTIYDEQLDRFAVILLEQNPCDKSSFLHVAVSDDSNPVGAWEMHALEVTESSLVSPQQTTWGDFPGLGWDADAFYVSLNMYNWQDKYDHLQLVTMTKASLVDGDAGTFTHFEVTRASPEITWQPAVMHGAVAGDPMYFVTEAGFENGSKIRVVKMTDKLSSTPTFESTDIAVDPYLSPRMAQQRGSKKFKLETNDTSILNAEWRGGRLVAAHHVGLRRRKETHARWYEFNTATMTLTQQGTIDPGKGVHTYFPTIAIAANGDLGLTYTQSSKSEYVSMYITGQRAGAVAGTVETPLLAKAGEATYVSFGKPPFRAGDYSSIVVDPSTGTSFWAAHEYATSDFTDNWGTWITSFSLQ